MMLVKGEESYQYDHDVIIIVYWLPQWLKTWPRWTVSLSQTTTAEANKFTTLTATSKQTSCQVEATLKLRDAGFYIK